MTNTKFTFPKSVYRVTYRGFLQTVARDFDTLEQAELWAKQVGVFKRATITHAIEQVKVYKNSEFDAWMASEKPTYKPTDDSMQDRMLRRCWHAAKGQS
jgi:hypothetical protein